MRGIARTPQEWETLVSNSFVPLAVDKINTGPTGFRGVVDSRPVGAGTSVHRVRADGSRLRRNLRVSADREPSALFVIHQGGEGRVEQFERRAAQLPGQCVLYLSDAPYTLDFASSIEETVIHLPVSALSASYDDLRRLSARTFSADAPVAGLQAYAGALLKSAPTDARVEQLGDTITYLADVALATFTRAARVAPTDDVLRERARRYVELHAHDASLTPDSLARAISVSRRRLYGLFEALGESPAALIRDARVSRAVHLLCNEPYLLIAEVWPRAGFRDERTFSRAIVSHTGTTPSALRRQALSATSDLPPKARYSLTRTRTWAPRGSTSRR